MALVFKPSIQTEQPISFKKRSVKEEAEERLRLYLRSTIGSAAAEELWQLGQRFDTEDARAQFFVDAMYKIEAQTDEGVPKPLENLYQYKWQPVGVREFICSVKYLNKKQELYPLVLDQAEELNSGKYVEAVLTGGIGSGKTTLAIYTTGYQLYLLSCMRNPHKMFGLDPSSEILLIFQSITKQLAKGVDYQRFRSMIEGSGYFKQYYPFDPELESKLVFPNRIEVVPVSGSETAAIGQNVMGGIIDELNYMAVVEKSKASVDKGTYDQAIAVYNSIARRRKSRFMDGSKLPGILCLVSSKKYPGQFTDQKMAEAKNDPTIFIYDKRVWEIKPDAFGQSGWFKVFVGDMTRKPRILDQGEQLTGEDADMLVTSVPNDFKTEFEKDIINALREIAGVSTLARHPFFLEVPKVALAFKKEHHSIFLNTPIDFVDSRLTIVTKNFWKPELPRFAHVDLAISGDSAGLAIGTVSGFKEVTIDTAQPAYMPIFHIDGVLEIRPPKNSEINFSKIREVFQVLMKLGLFVKWVTFDQFQSTDSQQILRQWGIITGPQSVDIVPCRPYDFLKSATYEERISMPVHKHLQKEILMLEKDAKTGKVDHPPGGSKDCADALAGVVYGLTMQRAIWALYRIPIMSIPQQVVDTSAKMEAQSAKRNPAQYTDVNVEGEYVRPRDRMEQRIQRPE